MATRIRVRRSTSAEWAEANPVLAEGEIAFDTDERRFKVGDGVTSWDILPFTVGEPSSGGGPGVVFATQQEVNEGTNETRAISPKTLHSLSSPNVVEYTTFWPSRPNIPWPVTFIGPLSQRSSITDMRTGDFWVART